MNYFESGHTDRGKYDLIILLESLRNEKRIGLSEMPDAVSQILNNVFTKAQSQNNQ